MKKLSYLLAALLTSQTIPTVACTDFQLTAKDGTVLITRSMEFALDMKSNIRTSVRGRQFTPVMLNGKPTLAWKAKYGYIFADGLDQDMAVDGMNEMGLSFEALYLPGETQYQTVPTGHEAQGIPYNQFGDWILSNFKTVDEVLGALPNIFVFPQAITGFGDMIFPLHFSIYDASGKGIVIEFVNGKMNLFNNEIGMLTNSPTYDWHITNLRNYLNLTPYSPQTFTTPNGITFAATGQGSGMFGLPGDASPPSRFVKISAIKKVAYPGTDATSTLNLAEHMINNVDIPLGLIRTNSNGKETAEWTQWVVFKDLTHKTFYYRSYADVTVRGVNMAQLNFAENAPRLKMPITASPTIIDMTTALKNAPNK